MELVKKIVGKRKILLFGFMFSSHGGRLVQVVGGVRFVIQRGDLRGEGLDLVGFGFEFGCCVCIWVFWICWRWIGGFVFVFLLEFGFVFIFLCLIDKKG